MTILSDQGEGEGEQKLPAMESSNIHEAMNVAGESECQSLKQ